MPRRLGTPVLCAQSLSHVPLFVTLWTVAHQAPRPGDPPDPGIKPLSHTSALILPKTDIPISVKITSMPPVTPARQV